MLVLSRKLNEKIIIGDDIEIVIVEISKEQIKLGINAPRSVKVFRSEVYDDIQAANRQAAAAKTDAGLLDTLNQNAKPFATKSGRSQKKPKQG